MGRKEAGGKMLALTVLPGISSGSRPIPVDLAGLGRLVNRTVPLEGWHDAPIRREDDVKPVIQLGEP